jgi:serine/threonine protein kinase
MAGRSISRVRNRPDLSENDLATLDRAMLDAHRQALSSTEYLAGDGSSGQQLVNPSTLDLDQHSIRQNGRSQVLAIKISAQWFACKINWIPKGNNVLQNVYQNEKVNLQTLRARPHWHVILLMWHFLKEANEGALILSPLAECDLHEFLSQSPTLRRKALVKKWIGCLVSAVAAIHDLKTKHKDIKAPNILIHGDNIILTDVDVSHTFEENSQTEGTSPGSEPYKAPEIREMQARGRKQDIWSLVCCLAEMVAYLGGQTIDEFRMSCAKPGEEGEPFKFTRSHAIVRGRLTEMISGSRCSEERQLIGVILSAFNWKQDERPLAQALLDDISRIGHNAYVGECCAARTASAPAAPGQINMLPDPRNFQFGSLAHFIASAGGRITDALGFIAAKASFDELLRRLMSNGLDQIHSFRSAEKCFLFSIAPVRVLVDSSSQ